MLLCLLEPGTGTLGACGEAAGAACPSYRAAALQPPVLKTSPPPASPPPSREHGGRRLLQQQLEQQAQREHLTHSEAWGTLRSAHQLLLTHAPRLGADERAQLLAAVEAAGCHVAAYVPDSSLLLVGSPQQAAALEAHPAVLRLVSWRAAARGLGGTRCRWLLSAAVMLPMWVAWARLAQSRWHGCRLGCPPASCCCCLVQPAHANCLPAHMPARLPMPPSPRRCTRSRTGWHPSGSPSCSSWSSSNTIAAS